MKTIKAKLFALISIAVLAISFLSAAAFYGLSEGKFWLDEIGGNRMPSSESLLQMKLALTDARRVLMETAIWENDYAAQSHFADVLRRRQPLWEAYAKEQKEYEPLPQTPDEEVRWRQYQRQLALYREEEARLAGIVDQMSRNADVWQQQQLFLAYYRSYAAMGPLFEAAASTLQSLIDITHKSEI